MYIFATTSRGIFFFFFSGPSLANLISHNAGRRLGFSVQFVMENLWSHMVVRIIGREERRSTAIFTKGSNMCLNNVFSPFSLHLGGRHGYTSFC